MYIAIGNQIMLVGKNDEQELFLTVHPTKDCTLTPEEQAQVIANLLNKWA